MTIRAVRLRAFCKLNLDLKVLNRDKSGYHELRTVFQTVTLADSLNIEISPARKSKITIDSDIPDNLIVKAAEAVLRAARTGARVSFKLDKLVPMGAGLGGGSTDAAAVLLALPVLLGRNLPLDVLIRIARELGSDVPFFLLGGTAVGLGRGTELYPLPDSRPRPVLILAPRVHISTAEAYGSLDRNGNGKLTDDQSIQYISRFQQRVWEVGEALPSGGSGPAGENDFEEVVFPRHPALKSILKKLNNIGAKPARMTGSGAALYGFFRTQDEMRRALPAFSEERAFPVKTLSRVRYRAAWWRALQEHMDGRYWPPRSRYAR